MRKINDNEKILNIDELSEIVHSQPKLHLIIIDNWSNQFVFIARLVNVTIN